MCLVYFSKQYFLCIFWCVWVSKILRISCRYIHNNLRLISISTEVRLAPRFSVIEERTSNGVPSVSIEFPDGYKDTLLLNKFYGNQEERMANVERCHYIGHLVNEPEACVAMTGCLGSEDVEFTILSTHAIDFHAFMWTKNGNVEILDSSSKVKISKASILPKCF